MNRYKDLKTEFRRQMFRDKIFSIHGHKCYNCGSDLYVELHHVVPLSLGGTNRETNIVPLCYECHKKAHGAREMRRHIRPHNVGRPKRSKPENYEKILWSYINGEIGRRECEELLGLTKSSKLTECSFYKEFLKENGIEIHKNNIDLWNANRFKNLDKTGRVAAKIYYTDGREVIKYVS